MGFEHFYISPTVLDYCVQGSPTVLEYCVQVSPTVLEYCVQIVEAEFDDDHVS